MGWSPSPDPAPSAPSRVSISTPRWVRASSTPAAQLPAPRTDGLRDSDPFAWGGSSKENLLEGLSLTLPSTQCLPRAKTLWGGADRQLQTCSESSRCKPPAPEERKRKEAPTSQPGRAFLGHLHPSLPAAGRRSAQPGTGDALREAGHAWWGLKRCHPAPCTSSPFPKTSSSCRPGSCAGCGVSLERMDGSGGLGSPAHSKPP